MKNITLLILVFSTYLFYSTSVASHIKPITSPLFLEPTVLNTAFSTLSTSSEASETSTKIITSSLIDQGDKTFNQELQWRILNLLAQQLFQNNNDPLENDLFTNHWLYLTQTFSVDISSINPDFYLVKIRDSQLGNETKLEIPRL